MAGELAFLGHAGAMKGKDVLESPPETTARRGGRQVRDKEMGAALKAGPMEGATLGPGSLSRRKNKAKPLSVVGKKNFLLFFFLLLHPLLSASLQCYNSWFEAG